MSVAFATRRLWLRRFYRLGMLFRIPLAPLFWVSDFFMWYRRMWTNRDVDSIVGGTIVLAIALGLSISIPWQMYLSRDATAIEIKTARKADTCVDGTLVRRAAVLNRPVSIRDVVTTQSDCADYWENDRKIKAQQAALKP